MRQLSEKEKEEEKVETAPPAILFDDSSLIVLDKPSGWIVNKADTTTNQPVVEKWIEENFDFPIFSFDELRHGIVHRLDKETSGVLILAKDKEAFFELQRQFKAREVKKTYLALAHGVIDPKEGEIRATVGRLPWRRDRFGVLAGGRDSVSEYKVKQIFAQQDNGMFYSLVEVFPKTGRTHQIRIHLKHLGHPIVGDLFYAGRKRARLDRLWCPRLFLHASKVQFKHPKTNEIVIVSSELPLDLQSCLENLAPSR